MTVHHCAAHADGRTPCPAEKWGDLVGTLTISQHKTLPLLEDLKKRATEEGEEYTKGSKFTRGGAWYQSHKIQKPRDTLVFPALGFLLRLLASSLGNFPREKDTLKPFRSHKIWKL